MHRQVKDLMIDKNGIAQSGILLRHLVLPDGLSGTKAVMAFIRDHISLNTYINIMNQYRPCGNAHGDKALGRSVTDKEYKTAIRYAMDIGLHRLDERRRVFVF